MQVHKKQKQCKATETCSILLENQAMCQFLQAWDPIHKRSHESCRTYTGRTIHNARRTYDCHKFGGKSTTYLDMSYNHHRRPLLIAINFRLLMHF